MITNEVKKYTLTIGEITNNGKKCLKPSVEILNGGDFSIACLDEGKNVYSLEGIATQENTCVTFLVRCEDCGDCPPKEITKCICSLDSDCGECEFCDESGFCETRCIEDEYCLNDNCVECDPENPCLDGKVCKNGRCVCPQDRPFVVGGRCLECIHTGVENCNECRDGVLVPLPCSGTCNPNTNQCVDCLQSSDCDGENECCSGQTCNCCEGYMRNQAGKCVAIPDCSTDDDCSSCQQCNDGKCDDILCPEGKICLGDNGCVDECDCNTSIGCSDDIFRCDSGRNGCGCVQCQGDCSTGCEDGCFCNGVECVADVCFGGKCPCNDGTDCPEGYGCNGSQCVPCSSLDCDNSECANVLGCSCSGGRCVDSDAACQNAPCVISDDCAFGCTCDDGVCKSCDNFTCAECGGLSGCACQGTTCLGQDESCLDTFELTKSNENCKLTAILNKQEDCACDALTVDVLGKKRSVGDSNKVALTFKGEVRKGAYQGDLTNPLLDNISNPQILENDSPTSGRITITGKVFFAEYTINVKSNIRTRIGSGQQADLVIEANFVTGNTASIEIGELILPTLNSVEVTERDDQNRAIREIKFTRVIITADITDNFDFPNGCTYRNGGRIGSYSFITNEGYDAFGFAYGNHKATTIQSSESRLPAFRWYKSDMSGVMNGIPFRKLYIEKTQNNDYVDIIGKEEGVETCKYYKVISDCTCATSPDIYGVFCNPQDLEYTISNCGRTITIDPEVVIPCDVNLDAEFYFRAGSVYQTWLGSRWDVIAGASFNSSEAIKEVEFGIVCDTEMGCRKVYPVVNELDSLDITLNYDCVGDGTSIEILIPQFDAELSCAVDRVEFANVSGFFIPGNLVTLQNITDYTYTVYWGCGCESITKTQTVACCEDERQLVQRRCNQPDICEHKEGYTYTVDGIVIDDICLDLNSSARSNDVPYQIIRTKIGCPTETINVGAIDCCRNFDILALGRDETTNNLRFRVVNHSNANIDLIRTDGQPLANGEQLSVISSDYNKTIELLNQDTDIEYRINVTSTEGCGFRFSTINKENVSFGPGTDGGAEPSDEDPQIVGPDQTAVLAVQGNSTQSETQDIVPDCGTNTNIQRIPDGNNYTLRATSDDIPCGCSSENIEFRVVSAVDGGNDTMDVELFTDISNGLALESSNLVVEDVSTGVGYGITPDEVQVINIPKALTSTTVETSGGFVFDSFGSASAGNYTYTNFRVSGATNRDPLVDFFTAEDITSLTISLQGGTLSTVISTNSVGPTDYITFTANTPIAINLVARKPGEQQIVPITIVATNSAGEQFTDIVATVISVDNNGVASVDRGDGVQFDVESQSEVNVQLRLRVNSLIRVNGCSYSGNTESIFFKTGDVPAFPFNSVTKTLDVVNGNAKTKFSWKEQGGAVIQTDYSQTQSTLSSATIGDTYSVTTTCSNCQQTQTLTVCPPITGSANLDACFENVTFNISGDAVARTYNVTFEGTTSVVNIVGGVGTVAFANNLLENTTYEVSVELDGEPECTAVFNFATGTKDSGCV